MTISIEAGGFGRLARLTRTNDTNGYNAGDAVGAASGAGGRFQHDSLAVALPAAVPAATRTPSSVGDWIVFSFALKS